jgi:flagellar basal-body rod protein FlgC
MDVNSVGLSGVTTAALGTAVTANNIANVNTNGYKAKRLDQEDLAQGGTRPAALRVSQEPTAPEGSNVDLATEVTALMSQGGAYQANLKVIETENQMLGKALDLKA